MMSRLAEICEHHKNWKRRIEKDLALPYAASDTIGKIKIDNTLAVILWQTGEVAMPNLELVVNHERPERQQLEQNIKVLDACLKCGSLEFYAFENKLFCGECDHINGVIEWSENDD